MEAEDMAEAKVPGSTGSTGGAPGSAPGGAPGGGGWATVLPAIVLLLRAGVTDSQLSLLTDLRVRVQRGAFASDGGPRSEPGGRGSPGAVPQANPDRPEGHPSVT
jgi:hypothetical protein